MRHTSLYRQILFTFVLLFVFTGLKAQGIPTKEGERARYSVQIDIKKAYISGICGMLFEEGKLKSSVVNEFGFSAIDFVYDPQKDEVNILSVINKLDHWYIKKTLKHDLRELIHNLQKGENRYEDSQYSITYTFTPMNNIDGNTDENKENNEITE